jgi:hypothetical protein
MNSIASNIKALKAELTEQVTLVAVSKTKPVEVIMEAYQSGQRAFGENRVQELVNKSPSLPDDVEWHMIGHLQRNKVKYIANHIYMIHSIDSFKLIETVNTEAKKVGRTIKCLLQFHIATEESKFGMNLAEAEQVVKLSIEKKLINIEICGVMGMATYTDNIEKIRGEFKFLNRCFGTLKKRYFADDSRFTSISMGMSGDYRVAIEEGSTIVRIGSLIFGERE